MLIVSESMRDHWWWRPGWGVGRSFYTWHFTFEDQPAMQRLLDHYIPTLAAIEGLDPVDSSGLHLTTQGVGFTDEVSTDDVERIIAKARQYCADIAPFVVTIGPTHVEPETVKMLAQPPEDIIRIRLALRQAIADVWGENRIPEAMDGFRPHVTLAYSNSEGPAAPIEAALATCGQRSEDMRISLVSLINLNRDQKRYEWATVATVHLGR